MSLSAEQKAEMVQSLKDDYVVLTDIVCEVIADTRADMFRLGQEERPPIDLQQDKERLRKLEQVYVSSFDTTPEKAVDVIEQIYEISEKYDKLRMGR